MLKQNKGITLVALVITIIVLLILAGVSISLVVGDNGVLTQAQNASKKTDTASVDSAMQTAIAGIQTEFMGNIWTENVNAKLYDNVTNATLDAELQKLGYKLVKDASHANEANNATNAYTGAAGTPLAITKDYYIADKNAASATDTVYKMTVKWTATSAEITAHAAIQ